MVLDIFLDVRSPLYY